MEIILGYLQSGLSAIIPFIVLLGLLIFVHEMGHFLVAKFFGVRVEVFSLGFGKKIFQFKRGDTVYALSLIPLGGYVKMYGDEMGAELPEDQKQFAFTHKPVSQRIAVVLAGPLMNFFFAIFIFLCVALIGEELRAPRIGDVASHTKAYEYGFRSGDLVLSANEQAISTWDDFQNQIAHHPDKEMNIVVRRENSEQTADFSVKPLLGANANLLSADEYTGQIEGLDSISKAGMVGVRYDSIAHKAGLRTGDLILAVNDKPIKYFRELDNLFVALQGQPLTLKIERPSDDGKEKSSSLTIDLPKSTYASMQVLGIEDAESYLARVFPGTPAQQAGLRPGDKVLSVSDQPITTWDTLLNSVKNYKEGALSFKILREGQEQVIDIVPQMTSQMNAQGGEEKRYTVGILPWMAAAAPELTTVKVAGIGAAVVRGYEKTIDVTKMTLMSFLRLIQNKISPKNVGGVISIGQAAKETFHMGITYFLQMMAVISVNLFILNLLPIPILDGGHLLFYTIEALKGAPLSMRKMEVAQQVGLVLLMSLMAFALFNDVTRVFGSW